MLNQGLVNTRCLQVAKVTEQRECTQLVGHQQTFPDLTLVAGPAIGGKRDFPSVRRGELSGNQPLPECSLGCVYRLGVAQEEYVTQANSTGAVVLRKRVLVEASERCRE